MEARRGFRQEKGTGVAQVGFPFPTTCNVPDSEPFERPLSARCRLLLPSELLSCPWLLGVANRGPEWCR